MSWDRAKQASAPAAERERRGVKVAPSRYQGPGGQGECPHTRVLPGMVSEPEQGDQDVHAWG